jgi:hypothetical protein
VKKYLFFVLLFGVANSTPVQAKEQISVTPSFQQVFIEKNDKSVDAQIQIKNTTNKSITFALKALDFGSLDDSAGLVFQGESTSSLTSSYGLTKWLKISPSTITLEPGLQADITATISNEATLTPGGHYAAVIATTDLGGVGQSNTVQLKQGLSSLLFVTKKGGEEYVQSIKTLDVSYGFFTLPNEVRLQIQNSGNVHLTPRGLVQIKQPGGAVVAQGVINEDSALVLPDIKRVFAVPFHGVDTAWLPGRYTVHIELHAQEGGAPVAQDISFWYIGVGLPIALGILAVVLIFVTFVYWDRIKRGVRRLFASFKP